VTITGAVIMETNSLIKSYNSTTYYMGARYDLDIYIYADYIKWHLEASHQFSDDKISSFKQPVKDFIKNGIPEIAQSVIDDEIRQGVIRFVKENFKDIS
jgi:hypothetical protein